jgi:hypothetical protein
MRTVPVLSLLLLVACTADRVDDRPARWSYIATTIIEPNCGTAGCHSSLTRTAGLVLDNRVDAYRSLTEAMIEAGSYLVPEAPEACDGRQPFQSQLHYLLRGDGIGRMPPDAPLPEEDIALIERWLCAGAEDN